MKKTKLELIRELQILRAKTVALEKSLSERATMIGPLRRADEAYKGFFENAQEGFYQSTMDGRFLNVNPAFARMLGYAGPDALLSGIVDITRQYYVCPEDRQRFMHVMNAEGVVRDFEYWARCRDGTQIWISESARVVHDRQGSAIYFEGVVQDITTTRQTLEEMNRYRFMVEHAGNEVYLVHRDGRLAYVNHAAAASLGYTAAEMLTLCISDFDSRFGPVFSQHFDELKAKGLPAFETVHKARDGRLIPKEIKSVYLPIGEQEYVCGFGLDISDRKRAEKEVRYSEARMMSLVQVLSYRPTSRQDFLDYALDEAVKLTESKIGYIYYYDEQRREFTLNTWSREVMAECRIAEPQTVYQLDRTGIWGEAVRQRKTIVVNDFQAPNVLKRGYPKGHVPLHRFMTVPVFSGDRIVAVAGVANKETDYERVDELQLFLLMDTVWRIGEQNQAAETLRLRDAKIASIFRAAPIGIGMVVGRIFQEANDRLCKMTGYGREELIGQSARMLYPTEEDHAYVGREKYGQIDQKGTGTVETRWRHKDGSTFPVILSSSPLDVTDHTKGMTFTALDVSELKRAEEALIRSEAVFRASFHTSPDAININRLHDGMFVSVNEGFTRSTGYTEQDVKGKTSKDINIWVRSEDRDTLIEGLRRRGEVRNLEAPFRRKDGNIGYGLMSATLIDIDGVPHILSVTRDITERRQAQDAVEQSERKYRDLAELLPQVVFEFDLNGRFTYVNRHALRAFGYSQAEVERGLHAVDMIAPVDRERAAMDIVKMIKEEKDSGTEYTAIRKNGEEFPVIIYSTPVFAGDRIIGLRGIVIDITDRKRLESQLFQAQKLEAVGTLAGGMAHNFNNILMGVQGHVSMMLMDMTPDHPHYHRLRSIEQQVGSGADLTRQLLGFARGGRYEIVSLDINTVIAKTVAMFGKTKREIVIHPNLAKQDLTVMADRSQMEQMLVNLLVNAGQAMPAGGNIFIETQKLLLNEAALAPDRIDPGPYVKITVRDTGLGMDGETLARIFEPFFTTKHMGRGTGLGLATVYGIVKGYKGVIHVKSEQGQGTTFDIYLPLRKEAPGEKRDQNVSAPEGEGLP